MSLVASFAPSLRSGANDATPKVMWLSYSRNQCLRFWLRAHFWPSCAEELWGRDWLTIKLNNARISSEGTCELHGIQIDRDKRGRGCTGILIFRCRVRGWLRLLGFSPALSHFPLQTCWSPRSKTVIHCLKSCKEFLENASASAHKSLSYCLLREIQRT